MSIQHEWPFLKWFYFFEQWGAFIMADQKANIGVKRKKVLFSLNFPDAKEVLLIGDFNQWDPKKHPMKKNNDGLWQKHLFLYTGTYEYKFKVDGEWKNDPENLLLCPNSFGTMNNFIVV